MSIANFSDFLLFSIVMSLGIGLPIPIYQYAISVTDILLIFGAPILVRSVFYKHSIFLHKAALSGYIFLIGIGISILYFSFFGDYSALLGWFRTFYMFLFFYFLLVNHNHKSVLIFSFKSLLWTSVSIGLVSYIGSVLFDYQSPFVWENVKHIGWSKFRLASLDGHPNGAAQIIFFSLVVLIYLDESFKNQKWLIVFSVLALILTASKSLLVFFAAACIFKLFTFHKTLSTGLSIGCIILYLFLSHIIPIPLGKEDNFKNEYAFEPRLFNTSSINYYPTSYTINKMASISVFLDHPWIGIGSSRYIPEIINRKSKGIYPIACNFMQPHCTYTGVLARFGLFGIFGLIMMMYFIYYQLKSSKHSNWKEMFSILFFSFAFEALTTDFEYHRSLWFLVAWWASTMYDSNSD